MDENVLYLENDEEITAAIDKMLKSAGREVKIVVPKRSTLLQSIVNLKLLKKAADDAGKSLILVTGDRTSTHLAGRVGLQVAPTLKSTPSVPEVADQKEVSDTVEAEAIPNPLEEDEEPEPVKPAPTAPVAGPKPSYAKPMMVRKQVGEDEPPAQAAAATDKKKRVPDFNSFQKRILLGVAGLVVLVILFILNWYFTTANVTLYATGKQIDANFNFTVDPSLAKTDFSNAMLAGQTMSSSKQLTATATGTGKKDVGTPATGTITATNKCFNPGTIPAGTVFTAQGLSYTSTTAVAVPPATAVVSGGSLSCPSPTTASIPVQSNANGDNYNLAATGYTAPGYSSGSTSVTFAGGQMSGGTTKTATIIQQSDIDAAVTAALAADKTAEQKDLENKVSSAQMALSATFTATAGSITSNPAAGSEGSTAAITIPVTYTEISVSKADYTQLVTDEVKKQVTGSEQLYDTGIGSAVLTAKTPDAGGRWPFQYAANAYAGAKVDATAAAKALKGKRYGDAADIASQLPGVDSAQISVTPGWSTNLPDIQSHIHVTIKVAPKS